MSSKRNVVLYLDRELVEKSRELGFNLSKTFENHLKQLTTQFSSVNQANNVNSLVWCGRQDLDPNGFKSKPRDFGATKSTASLCLELKDLNTSVSC